MATIDKHRAGKSNLSEDAVDRWYTGLKKDDSVTANAWLANLKLVQTLYGKTPDDIVRMKPEQAYNFVLNMVKAMQSDGRSFSHIENMIKSVTDWLEFNGAQISEIKIPHGSRQAMSDEDTSSLQPIELVQNKPSLAEISLYNNESLILLKEKSESLLGARGPDFVEKLRELEGVLNSIDPAPDSVINSIDKMVNKGVEMDLGAYYFAAYSSSRDLDTALNIYKLTNSLMRYIALMDGFYETGDKDGLARANRLFQELTARFSNQLRYSIKISVEKFWPFWMFENMMKQRMLEGDSFADKELRYFILMKSSDTPLLYCNILDSHLESFNPNIALAFHYNQALIDILDDYYDIEEDLQSKMPNIFVMASYDSFSISEVGEDSRGAVGTITGRDTKEKIVSIVEWLKLRLEELTLPQEYQFMRYITAEHIRRLMDILS